MKPMSQKKYVSNGGEICPFCESSLIESTSQPETDTGIVWQDMICCVCKNKWQDEYVLAGYHKGS